jgi:hypothetical protein
MICYVANSAFSSLSMAGRSSLPSPPITPRGSQPPDPFDLHVRPMRCNSRPVNGNASIKDLIVRYSDFLMRMIQQGATQKSLGLLCDSEF